MIIVLKLAYWMMILAIGIAALLLVALFVAVVVKGLRHEDRRTKPDPDRLVDDQEGTEEGEDRGDLQG